VSVSIRTLNLVTEYHLQLAWLSPSLIAMSCCQTISWTISQYLQLVPPTNNPMETDWQNRANHHQAPRLPREINDKQSSAYSDEEYCALAERVGALESTVRQLTAVIEECLSISTESVIPRNTSTGNICPANNCAKAFQRIDHLHRHIRGINNSAHLILARILDQRCCTPCNKEFNRPCDLVRHEKSYP
jgi:uncharacterized Zn-finger protein